MVVRISRGHDWRYFEKSMVKGGENYYTVAVAGGEPPGRWRGQGAETLGLKGAVQFEQMQAIYGGFYDPRDPAFGKDAAENGCARLGDAPKHYKDADEWLSTLLAREPDATPERRVELAIEAEQKAGRQTSSTYLDLTFAPQKSVSVLHAALRHEEHAARERGDETAAGKYAAQAEAVESAMWAGNDAMLSYFEREAGYSRAGYHSASTPDRPSNGRWVDAHKWTAASFFQHTSRPVEGQGELPHLHIHNALLKRVLCDDGKWRAPDSLAIHHAKMAADALARRVLEEQLTRVLGIEWKTTEDGKSREVVGIDKKVRDLFSGRARQVTAAQAEQVADFTAHVGREPTALELSAIKRRTVGRTRSKKLKAPTTRDQRGQQWARTIQDEAADTFAKIVDESLGRIADPAVAAPPFDADKVVALAIADAQGRKAEFKRGDIVHAVDKYLPDCLGGLDAEQIERVREALADRALAPQPEKVGKNDEVIQISVADLVSPPPELRRADGTSMYEAAGATKYSTRAHMDREQLLQAAVQSGASVARLPAGRASAVVEQLAATMAAEGGELGPDQAAALLGVLSSGKRAEVLIGPAGTGKSFVVGNVAQMWEKEVGGRVFGLSTANRAKEVLAEEGIDRAYNIEEWKRAQERIGDGAPSPRDVREFALQKGDLVIVDEAGMVNVTELAFIQEHADAVGAKVLYAGDPRQLPSIGAGGGMRFMAEATNAASYELDTARRFTHQWERDASLRLRAGDASVLGVYDRHGRIVDGGTAESTGGQAVSALVADTLAGRRSLIIAGTNEQAEQLSAQTQAELVRLGRVGTPTAPLANEALAGVGDIIQTRRTLRDVRTAAGRPVYNRDDWKVLGIGPDGSLHVQRLVGYDKDTGAAKLGAELTLPGEYVAEHAQLSYAVTAHGAQGSTIYGSYGVFDEKTPADLMYVALSRGAVNNTAYVTTRRPEPDRSQVDARGRLQGSPEVERTPLQIMAASLERYQPTLTATEQLRNELAEVKSLRRLGAIWTDTQQLTGEKQYAELARQILPPAVAEEVLASEAAGPLWRAVRAAELAGAAPEEVLARARDFREFRTADDAAKVMHWRVEELYGKQQANVDSYVDRSHAGDAAIPTFGRTVAEVMEERVVELGELTAAEAPTWATEHLGPVPADPIERAAWQQRAGRVAAYREQYTHTDEHDAIGRAPSEGSPEARATWQAAWRALGEPERVAAENTQTDGQLLATVAAYERELAWAPDYVGDQLREVSRSAQLHHEQHQRLAAQLHAETDPARREELRGRVADSAQALADLENQRDQLSYVDEVRGDWYAATTEAREAAARAKQELAQRQPDQERAGERTTARELDRAEAIRRREQELAERRERYAGIAAEVLGAQDAAEVAAHPAAESLWRIVADAEARGADPAEVLATAAADERGWTGADSKTKVLHGRIRDQLAELDQHQADATGANDRTANQDQAATAGTQPTDRSGAQERRQQQEDRFARERRYAETAREALGEVVGDFVHFGDGASRDRAYAAVAEAEARGIDAADLFRQAAGDDPEQLLGDKPERAGAVLADRLADINTRDREAAAASSDQPAAGEQRQDQAAEQRAKQTAEAGQDREVTATVDAAPAADRTQAADQQGHDQAAEQRQDQAVEQTQAAGQDRGTTATASDAGDRAAGEKPRPRVDSGRMAQSQAAEAGAAKWTRLAAERQAELDASTDPTQHERLQRRADRAHELAATMRDDAEHYRRPTQPSQPDRGADARAAEAGDRRRQHQDADQRQAQPDAARFVDDAPTKQRPQTKTKDAGEATTRPTSDQPAKAAADEQSTARTLRDKVEAARLARAELDRRRTAETAADNARRQQAAQQADAAKKAAREQQGPTLSR